MKKNNRSKIVVLLSSLVLVLLLIAYFYSKRSAVELKSVEINNYEGQDLSSINDFRENSIKGPQYIDKNKYRLLIKGLTGDDVAYSYDDIVNNHQAYKKVVRLNCVEGWSVNILWEGVLVRDLVDAKKIPDNANTVIFRAYDGYSTSFPLEYIMKNDIIMAYKMNGEVMLPERGFPFQLVAENKWGYKWIKWITGIEFSSDSNYRGTWEGAGHSNSGDLNESFIERK